jgi:hypothetical protein
MDLNRRQFPPPGDDEAKRALLKQLKPDFPKPALAWLRDRAVTVEAPQRVDPDRVDWEQYDEWRASKQLKAVRKIAKKIDSGKDKTVVVMVESPGSEHLTIIDGHHHTLGYVDAKKRPRGYIVHVPEQDGPWLSLHDKQMNDTKVDDFGKTDPYDANE